MTARLAIIGRSLQAEWLAYHPRDRAWLLLGVGLVGWIFILAGLYDLQ
ncbi:hypothetical protein [Tardiphaga sp. vice154]|nr:hypothetical protein [Tardiphaga sp. vice154]